MSGATVGVLHPGEMGAAVGAALTAAGHRVLWASSGRSAATKGRAADAGMHDVETIGAVAREADVILSICPPHAAADVARAARGFGGIYVDANAVSPASATALAATLTRFVDGGIIGPPPRTVGTTRLYVSGSEAQRVADIFTGTPLEARVISADVGKASALKMAYAAWTKGTAALLLAQRNAARAHGIDAELAAEWQLSDPELAERLARAERSAAAKGWRWVAEMEEIADTFAAAGEPDGFHRAAADVYRRA
ncbi:MAG: DUF1932 domain-containing protein [Gaiellaceae bacterium]